MSGGCYLNFTGGGGYYSGATGFARIEASNYGRRLQLCRQHQLFDLTSTPNLYLPTVTPGTIKAISVNGVSLPASPTGSFATPDVSINSANSVPVVVQATLNVPPGTVVTLEITSEQGADMTIQCPGLTGTLATSTHQFPPASSSRPASPEATSRRRGEGTAFVREW